MIGFVHHVTAGSLARAVHTTLACEGLVPCYDSETCVGTCYACEFRRLAARNRFKLEPFARLCEERAKASQSPTDGWTDERYPLAVELIYALWRAVNNGSPERFPTPVQIAIRAATAWEREKIELER